jgi:hypothetical protein
MANDFLGAAGRSVLLICPAPACWWHFRWKGSSKLEGQRLNAMNQGCNAVLKSCMQTARFTRLGWREYRRSGVSYKWIK